MNSAPHEFFEHTADIGVRVWGATLPELFANAARAMFEALGKLQKAEVRSQKRIELRARSREDLLHDWLAELLYEVEASGVLYDEFEFQELSAHRLAATVRGGKIDFSRSETNEEIKAVTYHDLRVEKLTNGTFRATVIFDV